MSSIYRKGRDGYFYYQAYVYNSKTKKKDKRIFHSLGTKKREEALIKQKKYDLEYEKKNESHSNLREFSLQNYKAKMLMKIIVATGLIIIISSYFLDKSEKMIIKENYNITEKQINKNIDTLITPQKIIESSIDTRLGKKENNFNEKQNHASQNNTKVQETPKNSIVNYTIERVEILSGVFDQGKIYITAESKSSDDQLHLLCNKVREKYDEFANIIICVYSDDSNGILMAKGMDADINNAEKKKAWLAMYSFNPVEGEYFDNNPSSYLGLY